VTEGKLAAKLIAKKAGVATWASIQTMLEVQNALKLKSSQQLVPLINRHLKQEPYTLAELSSADCFGVSPTTLFEGRWFCAAARHHRFSSLIFCLGGQAIVSVPARWTCCRLARMGSCCSAVLVTSPRRLNASWSSDSFVRLSRPSHSFQIWVRCFTVSSALVWWSVCCGVPCDDVTLIPVRIGSIAMCPAWCG
jgi:hypothetical protein